jgi:glutathione synthase/RimK-type ligase-like ATP-grasp enzyme
MAASSATGRVVAISGREDAHLAFVERHLRAPLIVIDARELVNGAELSFTLSGSRIQTSFGGQVLDPITGVWFRKPQPISEAKIPVSADFQGYSKDAMSRHAELLLGAFEGATWVSDYFRMLRASNKMLGSVVAKRIGFLVPDSVATSNADVARDFISRHPTSISKSLTPAYPKIAGRQHILFTRRIDMDHPADLTNLHLAPSIFQEAIPVAREIRAIVVADQVFAASLESRAPATPETARFRDNRLGNPHVEEIIDFPKEVADLCRAHCKALGLKFGALDLIMDDHNKYWFLENNPNGQWAFVEDTTGMPIGQALARLLEQRHR